MTVNWRPDFRPESLYFITTKAVDYIHIFQRDLIKRLLIDTFDCFRLRKRWKLYCFVIMPNHIHFIAQFAADDPFPAVMRDLKRHTADRIIRHAQLEQKQPLLSQGLAKAANRERQSFKIWEDGYLAKEVVTQTYLQEKMNYIHQNPCQPHWRLSDTPEEYFWSTASYYMSTQPSIIPIDDVRKIDVIV